MLNDLEEGDRMQILVFALVEPRYALYLSAVERVIQAVEITRLPVEHRFILGVIDMQGQVIPVVDIRPCFGMPAREVNQNDLFILARTSTRLIALVADSVAGIHEMTRQELVTASQLLPGMAYIHSLAKVEGELVLICDLDQFLSREDEKRLEAALKVNSEKAGRRKQRKVSEAA